MYLDKLEFSDLFSQDKISRDSYTVFNSENKIFFFNRKYADTMFETLSLTPRERHRAMLEQKNEV